MEYKDIFIKIFDAIMKLKITFAGTCAALVIIVNLPQALKNSYELYVIQQGERATEERIKTEEEVKKSGDKVQESERKIAAYKEEGIASRLFVNELGVLIRQAAEEIGKKQSHFNIIPAAQAIVAVRNEFRSSLYILRNRLNSEIDQLEREVSKKKPNEKKISNLIDVINRKWPAKKLEIDIESRKLLPE